MPIDVTVQVRKFKYDDKRKNKFWKAGDVFILFLSVDDGIYRIYHMSGHEWLYIDEILALSDECSPAEKQAIALLGELKGQGYICNINEEVLGE